VGGGTIIDCVVCFLGEEVQVLPCVLHRVSTAQCHEFMTGVTLNHY